MAPLAAPRRLRDLILLALAASASGCVLLPSLGGPPPREGEAPIPAPWPGLVDLRGIVHCHSLQSHDSRGTFAEIAAAASEVGARFVILTDHLRAPTEDPGPDGLVAGVRFIPGVERRSRSGGSLLVLGARAGIDPGLADAEAALQARAQGALVAIGHPEQAAGGGLARPDGVELMNLHADVQDECYPWLLLRALVLPPGAFFAGVVSRQAAAAAVYDQHAPEGPLAALGGCDAHEAVRLLGPLGGAVDSYRRVFRCATTHVLVADDSRAAILAALRAGRSYAACELERDATGFRVVARRDLEPVGTLGDEVTLAPGLELLVEAPAPCRLTVLCDGATAHRACGTGLVLPLTRPGAYRVEAELAGIPWVATSAIRVVRAPP